MWLGRYLMSPWVMVLLPLIFLQDLLGWKVVKSLVLIFGPTGQKGWNLIAINSKKGSCCVFSKGPCNIL